MVRLIVFLLLLAPVAQAEDFLIQENQKVVVARFEMPNPTAEEKLTPEVYELMRFFGITMSQERLIETKQGRSLYKITQKNALGVKSEFYEMRWRQGDSLVIAGSIDSSPESLQNLKALPQNPWAERKTASSQSEAGTCPTCFIAAGMLKLDKLVVQGREWVAVDCQANKVDGKVTGGKIISAIGSCLRGIALAAVDILKLVYQLLSTQIKAYTDYRYAMSLVRIFVEAGKDPKAFTQNLFVSLMNAAKEQYGKLKTCNIDYQVGFTCQLLTDILIPGGAIIKGVKIASRAGKGAAEVLHASVQAEAKVLASTVKPAAKGAEEVTLTAKAMSDNVEYVATANGKEVAKATSDQVQRHLDATETPDAPVLAKEVEAIEAIKAEISPGLSQLAITGKRRAEIERLYKQMLDEKPDQLNPASVAKNGRVLDELSNLLVKELEAKGIRAKAVAQEGWKTVGNPAELQKAIARSEEAIKNAAQQMAKAAPGSITHRNFHKLKLAEHAKLKDYQARLHDAEMSRLTDTVEIDLSSTPELQAVAEKLKVSRIRIPLKEFQNGEAYSGMFRTADRSIELGVNSVLNPEGLIDAVARHEFHHAATLAKKMRGANYPFFAQVFSAGGHAINTLVAYSKYFDFDEIPAYSRSVAYAERGLENPSKIAVHEGMAKASTSRKVPVDLVRTRADQLKHMAHSGLEAIKMARDTLQARGLEGLSIKVGSGPAREIGIPLYKGIAQVGKMIIEPPALKKLSDKNVIEEVSKYLDEMEAATRAHLASAERTLVMEERALSERIQKLTERSKNARSRGGTGKPDTSTSGN